MAWQVNKTTIIVDASKYIEELKEKVERLTQDISAAQTSDDQNPLPMVIKFLIFVLPYLFFVSTSN